MTKAIPYKDLRDRALRRKCLCDARDNAMREAMFRLATARMIQHERSLHVQEEVQEGRAALK